MSYIILDDIPLKIKSIGKDPQLNVVNKSYVGVEGSFIRYKGSKGRKLELSVYVGKDQVTKVEELERKGSPVILISESMANYNGQYYVTEVGWDENKKGIWSVSITLLEYVEPNVVLTDFENWNVSSSGGGAGGDQASLESPLSNCPTLQQGDRGDCVTELQAFLKLSGYYVYVDGHSLTIDDYFGQYTENSVIAFQQAMGITANGVVGPETKEKIASYL